MWFSALARLRRNARTPKPVKSNSPVAGSGTGRTVKVPGSLAAYRNFGGPVVGSSKNMPHVPQPKNRIGTEIAVAKGKPVGGGPVLEAKS